MTSWEIDYSEIGLGLTKPRLAVKIILGDVDPLTVERRVEDAKRIVKKGLAQERREPVPPSPPMHVEQQRATSEASPPPGTGGPASAPSPAPAPPPKPSVKMPSVGKPHCEACSLETEWAQFNKTKVEFGRGLCSGCGKKERAKRGTA